jgi:hypothetical protein
MLHCSGVQTEETLPAVTAALEVSLQEVLVVDVEN